MRIAALVFLAVGAFAQQRADVLYDEAKVPSYTLPDVLGGSPSAKAWASRRQKILDLYRTEVFGRSPAKPAQLKFDVTSVDRGALGGRAVRKLVTISWPKGPQIHMLLYLPANRKAAPVFLGLSFAGNHTIYNDPGVPLSEEWVRDPATKEWVKRLPPESSRGKAAEQWQLDRILQHGYGLATIYYDEIEPDFDGGMKYGIRPAFFKPAQTAAAPDEWGAIGAWAWGLSRAMDYLETDRDVDAKHVAVFGHSRLGKTALWASAQDTRFAMAISNESGEGGAAISRRDYGERTEDLNAHFPHWFCANFREYNHHEEKMPFDSHFLLALSAPRPLYVASALEDRWSDPRGEFLGAFHASRVYELLGKKGIGSDQMPELHHPVGETVRYHIRAGKHSVTDYDWEQYLKFADEQWAR